MEQSGSSNCLSFIPDSSLKEKESFTEKAFLPLLKLPWNALFVSGWSEITKNGFLPLILKSITL